MRLKFATASALVSGLGILLVSAPRADAAPGYSYSVVGNPADVVTATSGLLVLQGGGTDVDENFVRMGARAGGGDFVVIRASGTDAYNPYIYSLCSCDSVATIVFKNRNAAFQPFVIDTIRNAEALFIAGGDQSKYVQFWKNTPVEDAINFVAAKPAPIGGTSAGMAIMSQFLYSAMSNSSLDSAEGLADPFHRDLTLDRDFLSLAKLEGKITDQHLIERDRMGRTMAFLARLVQDGWTTEGRAIAADRETALHVSPADWDGGGPEHAHAHDAVRLFPAHPRPARGVRPRHAAHLPQRRRLPHRPRRHVRSRHLDGNGRDLVHPQRGGRSADLVARRDLLGLARRPGVDAQLEHVQGQGARAEHLVVEPAQIETRAQGRGRARPQLLDLELADLVGEGLGRPDDVAVHLHHDVVLGLARVFGEEVDRLLPASSPARACPCPRPAGWRAKSRR